MTLSLSQLRSKPDPLLISEIEQLLVEAKAGKIKQIVWCYEQSDKNVCHRFKHHDAGADRWKLLGMIEQMKLDLWDTLE